MKKVEDLHEIKSEELKMTSKEFVFIRKKIKLSQKDVGFLGVSRSGTTISRMESEEYVNPTLVYQLISGIYAPREVIIALRKEYAERKADGK